MINLFKRLLRWVTLSAPEAVEKRLNKSDTAKFNPSGSYYKHKITNEYIYMHSMVCTDCFEFVDNATIEKINNINAEKMRESLDGCLGLGGNRDINSYNVYPRSSMATLKEIQLNNDYDLVDIYTADPYFTLFVNSLSVALYRINELKLVEYDKLKALYELGLSRPLTNTPAEVTQLINHNEELNYNRFDRIE